MEANNIGYLFLQSAGRRGNKIAIRQGKNVMTYQGLRKAVICCALHLRTKGIGQNSLVSIDMYNDPTATIATIFALSLNGASWLDHRSTDAKSKENLVISKVLTDKAGKQIPESHLRITREFFTNRPAEYQSAKQLQFPGYVNRDDKFYISSSSGTTGSPKLIPLSSSDFIERSMLLKEYQDSDIPLVLNDRFFKTSNIATLNAITVLGQGGTYAIVKNYQSLYAYGINHVVGSVHHLMGLLENVPVPAEPLIFQVRVVGTALLPQFLEKLLKYFQTVRVSYGSTEAGPLTTRLLTEYSSDRSVGKAYEGVSIEIVDENDKVILDGKEGIVRVMNEGQAIQYLGAAKETETAFKGGWFYPGDRGYLSDDGQLYITGRLKDHLNINGVKINAENIDEIIQSSKGVKEGLCFSETDQDGVLSLAVAVHLDETTDVAAVVKDIYASMNKKKMRVVEFPTKIYEVDEIPRNSNGKPMRHKLTKVVENITPRNISAKKTK
ncbi:MAG: hypothetical protein COB22_08095 [Cycloclasticus sp.]|nr:MAG: hypothetical protein COB22_08095 [Cycloclasticus sp.]